MAEKKNLRAVGDRIEQLLDELRAAADPRIYGQAEEMLGLVTDLYGGGLARIAEIVGEEDPAMLDRLAGDELVSSLLLVHGLHPEDLATRVGRALEGVRPMLASHGGDVELLDIDVQAGAVHLNLLGSCHGCPSSTVTLRLAVETAIAEAAPEIVIIDVEQPHEEVAAPGSAVPITLGTKTASYEECPAELVPELAPR
ncbi:MAG TPA: NifU family protein [Acidimicrobiales bacterium]|jgi:Fe-S cluster biogenesis protein NfuA|nr:NifU family protein [Acidimicrobiales bacterium]